MSAPMDVLAVMDADRYPLDTAKRNAMIEAREAVAELVEAAKAWNHWDYEIESAKVNGESVYSHEELFDMRVEARRKTDAALARVQGEGA